MSHLAKNASIGKRIHCELSQSQVQKHIKENLVINPFSRIDDWIFLGDEEFIKHFQALFDCFAVETYRVKESLLSSALQQIWKTDKNENQLFCGKFTRAWQYAWLKSKRIKTGERTSQCLMSIFEIWANKSQTDPSERLKLEASKSSAKVEPDTIKNEPSSVKYEPGSVKVRWAAASEVEVRAPKVKCELPSPCVKRSLTSSTSSPLVPSRSSPKVSWETKKEACAPTALEHLQYYYIGSLCCHEGLKDLYVNTMILYGASNTPPEYM